MKQLLTVHKVRWGVKSALLKAGMFIVYSKQQ